MPDAFLFAIVLTLIVYILGFAFTGSTPVDMVQYWGDGVWELLDFAMQMTLIVVTGYILASTPIVKSILSKLASIARTPGQAIIIETVVSVIACLINYGFGLVVAALFARQIIRYVPKVDYRLLIASGYTGFLVWHGGFSGSVPLKIATPDHFLQDTMGVVPITDTLFSSYNIVIVLLLFITLPILNRLMMKATDARGGLDPELLNRMNDENEQDEQEKQKKDMTPAERMENSVILSVLIGILGLAYIVFYFAQNGFNLTINIMNFIFLFLGILLHKTPGVF